LGLSLKALQQPLNKDTKDAVPSEVEGVEAPKKTESKVEAPAEGLEQSREEEVPAAEVKEEKKEEPAV
jgi:hypothetical protein